MSHVTLGRIDVDRRREARREGQPKQILTTQQVFERWERAVLKEMERRRELRREQDVRVRLATVG